MDVFTSVIFRLATIGRLNVYTDNH